jgi:hypothetical protein
MVCVPNFVQISQLLQSLCEGGDGHTHAAQHSIPTFFAKEKKSAEIDSEKLCCQNFQN